MTLVDIVDDLVGTTDELAVLRQRRPVTVEQLQASYDALFDPISTAEVSAAERALIAAFATALTADDVVARHYKRLATNADVERADAVSQLAVENRAVGPFGNYREAGLQQENSDGARFVLGVADRVALGERLSAALEHTHLLTVRPREADEHAIAALKTAGWSADGIVTLSQLVAFLAFQQRVIIGLRGLKEELA